MSLVVSGINMPFEACDGDAVNRAVRELGLSHGLVKQAEIHKISFDLRHGRLSKVYSVELDTDVDEAELVKGLGLPSVKLRVRGSLPVPTGNGRLEHPPVIIGFGPAGLFAALVLAKNGYRPIVLEQGGDMDKRDKAVDGFFAGGELDCSSNIQFGEGGAGAYSDGKLTTRINDGRCQLVLNLLEEYGAEKSMLIKAKPHIGTDKLKDIVKKMRTDIIRMGGRVFFESRVDDFDIKDGRLKAVRTAGGEHIPADVAVLATGHSARDMFSLLCGKGIDMEAKPFSVGVRAEHLQEDINAALYGKYAGTDGLPKGEYALSRRVDGRGCYTFCMCPGGYVVAAASEKGGIVTNGMSYHDRAGKNANAAVCVAVTPKDFGFGVLDGVGFQRMIEQRAFEIAGGKDIGMAQRYDDFVKGRPSKAFGRVTPTYPRGCGFADINAILPDFVCDMIKSSMPFFGRKIKGYDSGDTVFTAPETRTSSPVRIIRGEDMFSPQVSGLIPCGEGAGYAGGIVSAAVDGIRAAERIMGQYAPGGDR